MKSGLKIARFCKKFKYILRFFKFIYKMIWLESPTNPFLKLVDIEEACKLAKKKNPDVIIVFDNTFATPYFQVIKINHCRKYVPFL